MQLQGQTPQPATTQQPVIIQASAAPQVQVQQQQPQVSIEKICTSTIKIFKTFSGLKTSRQSIKFNK